MPPLAQMDIPRIRLPEAVPMKAPEKAPMVKAPQALAKGLENGLGNTHATLGHLAKLDTDLASPTPKAESTAPSTSPTEAKTAGTQSKDTKEDFTLKAIEKATAEAHVDIDKHVNDSIAQWDKDNPQPDQNADPIKYNEWISERSAAQTSAREGAMVNVSLKSWDKDNPAPNKKDTKAYNEWVEKRAEKEKQLKEEVSNRDKDKDGGEKDKKKELSAAEVTEKLNRLKQLEQEIMHLNEGIKQINAKTVKTDEDKLKLAEWQINRDGKVAEVNKLKAEIGNEITKASPLKKVLIITALLAASGTAFVASNAKAA